MKFYISTIPVMVTRKRWWGRSYREFAIIGISLLCENGNVYVGLNSDMLNDLKPEKRAELLKTYPEEFAGFYWVSSEKMERQVIEFVRLHSDGSKACFYGYGSAKDEVVLDEIFSKAQGVTPTVIDMGCIEIAVASMFDKEIFEMDDKFEYGVPAGTLTLSDRLMILSSHEDYPTQPASTTNMLKRNRWLADLDKFLGRISSQFTYLPIMGGDA